MNKWNLTEHAIAATQRRTEVLEAMIRNAVSKGVALDRLWVRVTEEPSDDVIERSDLMCHVEGLRSIVLDSFEIRRPS